MMDCICGFWSRLKPKAKIGGRVQMNFLELCIAALSARVSVVFDLNGDHTRPSIIESIRFGFDPGWAGDEEGDPIGHRAFGKMPTCERIEVTLKYRPGDRPSNLSGWSS